MTNQPLDSAAITHTRLAGLLYIIIIACGIFSEAYVRASLIVQGDATATANNILASTSLFRIGFAADTLMLLSDVAIAVIFYLLFRPVHRGLALAAAAFRLTQASILGMNLLNYYAALLVLDGVGFAGVFEPGQSSAMAMLFLEMHAHGYDIGLSFFGVSNIILGYLVIKSGYFPSVLGYGLIAASLVYLAGSAARFLSPDYSPLVEPMYMVPFVAELSFCLWLLLKGARAPV